MGSLDESNDTSMDLESEHETTSNDNESSVRPALDHDESIQIGSSFTSCSSSISSDYSLDKDLLQEFDTEIDKSSLKLDEVDDDPLAATEHEHDETLEEQLSSDSEALSSASSPPVLDYNSESPPKQVMERPESSKYRIPSHVFARRNSSTPGDWSMASNESLFSIQLGGTSFCNPELGLGYGSEAYLFSPQLNSPYDSQFVGEADNSYELDGEDKFHEFDDVDDQDSNMVDINLNDNEDRLSTADRERIAHSYADSASSSKSFMFPILAGETEKGGSPSPHEEPKVGGTAPQSPSNPETSEAKEETKKPTPLVAWTKWFPCFRYCTCCS